MWLVYNDEPTNTRPTFSLGHSKGTIVADKSTGYWLVHSVPKFPQLPYQNNSYTYPKTGLKFGQSFLCMSMVAKELDKVGKCCWLNFYIIYFHTNRYNILINYNFIASSGNQLINNEVLAYGSHFGKNLKQIYPSLYNASLPHHVPRKDNNGVKVQPLLSQGSVQFLSISKNRHFGKGK